MVKATIDTDFTKLKTKINPKKNNFPNSLPGLAKGATYRVVTYQIPVPLGDCSAHLLVSGNGKTVHSAFLMDGGVAADDIDASDQIGLALKFIDKQHGTDWKFHAWVVTHWDADHFYGMIDLFENNGWNPCRSGKKDYFSPDRVLCCGGDPTNVTVGSAKISLISLLSKMGFQYSEESMGENLIGRDLFSGDHILHWHTANPMLDLNTLERPTFCVLAANGYGIGQAERFTTNPSPNQTSILSIVLWPESKRCSYYTGGDGHPAVARKAIVPFLNETPVTVLKLDHHGSSGELLGLAKDKVATEDIVSTMRPEKVLVTPGDGYGHPSWDVVAFIYGHYKSINLDSEGRLYTTRSPYWAQADKLSGRDVNLGKINKIWEILESWNEKPTEEVVLSWDAWKTSFKMADLKKPDNAEDEDWRPDPAIAEAAITAKHFDEIGEEAEEALFETFVEEYIQLAKDDPGQVFTKNQAVPTVIDRNMFKSAQWRTLFGKWKWANIGTYRKALGTALKHKRGVPELSLEGDSPEVKGIEYLIARQEERTAWADTMRHLWNHLSPQPVNADPGQCQRYLLCLTSRDSSTDDGIIEFFNPDGSKVEPLKTNLRGADTRSYTLQKGWTKRNFAAHPMTKEEETNFKEFAALRNKEKELESEIRKLQLELKIKDLRALPSYSSATLTTKRRLKDLYKLMANRLEVRKKLYEK